MTFRRNVEGYYGLEKDQGTLRGIAPRVIEKQNKIKEICLNCTQPNCNGQCALVDKKIKGVRRGRKPKLKDINE